MTLDAPLVPMPTVCGGKTKMWPHLVGIDHRSPLAVAQRAYNSRPRVHRDHRPVHVLRSFACRVVLTTDEYNQIPEDRH